MDCTRLASYWDIVGEGDIDGDRGYEGSTGSHAYVLISLTAARIVRMDWANSRRRVRRAVPTRMASRVWSASRKRACRRGRSRRMVVDVR